MDVRIIDIIVRAHDSASSAFTAMARRIKAALDGMGINKATGEVSQFRQMIDSLGQSLSDMGNSAEEAGASLGSIGFALAIKYAQTLTSAVILLGGALVALAGSAAEAAGAIGGALVAGMGQAIPIVGVLAATMLRLKDVFAAVHAQTKANQAATQGATGAQKAQTDSAYQLARAHEQVVQAEKQLSQARQQAKRDLQDLLFQQEQARLSAQRAELNSNQARKDLANSVASGDVLGAANAQINVQDATLNASKSNIDAARAAADYASAQKKGVEGSDRVVQAKQSLIAAEHSLTQAMHATTAAANTQSAAVRNLDNALAKLSPTERKLVTAIQNLQKAAATAVRPITDQVIGGITYGVNKLIVVLKDPAIERAFLSLGKAMGQGIRVLADFLGGPLGKQFAEFFAGQAAKNIPIFVKIFTQFLTILGTIGKEATPIFNTMLRDFSKLLGGVIDYLTKNKKGVSQFFEDGKRNLYAWLSLFGAVVKLFAALTGEGGAKAGLKIVKDLTSSINDLTAYVQKHHDEVQKYFDDVVTFMSELGAVLVAVIKQLALVFDPANVKNLAGILTDILIPAAGNVVRIFGALTNALHILFDLPFVKTFLMWAVTAVAVVVGMMKIREAIQAIRLAAYELLTTNPLLLAIALIITAIFLLDQKFHFLAPTIKFIQKIFQEFVDYVKGSDLGLWFKRHVDDFITAGHLILDFLILLYKSAKIQFDLVYYVISHTFDILKRLFNTVKGPLESAFEFIFSGLPGIVETAFEAVYHAVAVGINGIITGINWLIGVLNDINPGPNIPKIGKLGTDLGGSTAQTPGRSGKGGAQLTAATGAYVPARPGGTLVKVGEAGADEVILSTDPRHAATTDRLLSAYSSRTGRQLASKPTTGGGSAGPVGVEPGTPDIPGTTPGTSPKTASDLNLGWVKRLIRTLQAARRLDAMNIPYSYGGGHGSTPAVPSTGITSPSGRNYGGVTGLDCSSSVSRVLQDAGFGIPTEASTWFESWGESGPGLITTWANAGHVFMDILGQRYGTGSGQPGGGFGLNSHGTGGFIPRHPSGFGFGDHKGAQSIFGKIMSAAGSLGSTGLNALSGIGDWVKHLGKIPGADNPIARAIYNFVKKAVASAIPFANGGIVTSPTLAMIGEQGPEAVVPLSARHGASAVHVDFFKDLFAQLEVIEKTLRPKLGRNKLAIALDKIVGPEGILDKMAAQFQKLVAAGQARITMMTYTTKQIAGVGTVAVRQGSDVQIADAAAANASQQLSALRDEGKDLATTQSQLKAKRKVVADRLKVLGRHPRNNAKQIAALRKLLPVIDAALNNVANRIAGNASDAQTAEGTLYDAQQAAVQARTDAITGAANRATGNADIQFQLAQLANDRPGMIAALTTKGSALTTERGGLEAQLAAVTKAYGANSDQAKALSDALLQNQLAIAENTDQLKTINGEGDAPQSFSTTAWQLFRWAITNGSGQLLGAAMPPSVVTPPSAPVAKPPGWDSWTKERQGEWSSIYGVPSMGVGGSILRDGLIFAHAGENIVPANISRSIDSTGSGDTNISLEINEAGGPIDTTALMSRLAFEMRNTT